MKEKLQKMVGLMKARPPIPIPSLETPKGATTASPGTVSVKNKSPMITDSPKHVETANRAIDGAETASPTEGASLRPYGIAGVGKQGQVAYVDTSRLKQKDRDPERMKGTEHHEAQHQLFDQYINAGNFKPTTKDPGGQHAQLATALISKAGLDKRDYALLHHLASSRGYNMGSEPDEAITSLVESLNSGYDERLKMYSNANKKMPLPKHETFANYVHGMKKLYSKLKSAAGSFKQGEEIQGLDPKHLTDKYGSDWSSISQYEKPDYSFRVNKVKPKDNIRMNQEMREPAETKATSGGFAGYARKDEKIRGK